MEKRVVLAVVLCVAAMFIWLKIFPPPTPTPTPATPAAPTAPANGAPAAPPAPANGAPAATGAPANGAAPAAPSVAEAPEQELTLEVPGVERFVFSSFGGTLKHARLLEAQFLDKPGDPTTGHDLVTTLEPSQAAMRTTFLDAGFGALPRSWQASQPAPDTVLFVAENAAARVEKRYRLDTTRYRLTLDLVVHNKTDKSQDHALTIALQGRQDPDKKGGSFLSGGPANQAEILCAGTDDKPKREPIEKLAEKPIDVSGTITWMAANEKFFVLAAAPYPAPDQARRTCHGGSNDGVVGEAVIRFQSRPVPAREATTYAFAIFAGPKFVDALSEVKPGNVEIHLDKAVDIDWLAPIARLILFFLRFFHGFVHNWGVAIILLTIFIKLVTFYPTQKSLLSAKKMQRLAPKMNAIRKKYENDRQRQSVETMNLYKAHGVSPFGGCLPSLIQMPIWIALYSTLNYAVELYRAPFFLHIHDLTAKDPFYATPLLMGGVMFLQMRMSPASPDNEQQKMMQIMMPIMFTAFSLVLPSGLALYMLTSYTLGIVQQLYINYLDKKQGAPA
jgi:YidC/Oxa1 family membrane protein insertase